MDTCTKTSKIYTPEHSDAYRYIFIYWNTNTHKLPQTHRKSVTIPQTITGTSLKYQEKDTNTKTVAQILKKIHK